MKHFHIYFNENQKDELLSLLNITQRYFPNLYYGRIHNKPVGPHPIGSCLIATKTEAENVQWLGQRYEINRSIFERKPKKPTAKPA